jgi:hypothetical protein
MRIFEGHHTPEVDTRRRQLAIACETSLGNSSFCENQQSSDDFTTTTFLLPRHPLRCQATFYASKRQGYVVDPQPRQKTQKIGVVDTRSQLNYPNLF